MKKQNWAPRDPRAQVTGFSWTAWKCWWQPAPWLSADVRVVPDPHQLLTSGGGKCPSCSCGRLWERSALAARAHSQYPVSHGPSPDRHPLGAPLRAGPRGLRGSARQLGVLASAALSEQVGELGSPWATPVRLGRPGRSGSKELVLVFIPVRGCTLR